MTMRAFRWLTANGDVRTAKADAIEFGPSHIIFLSSTRQVILAEHNDQVHALSELDPDDD